MRLETVLLFGRSNSYFMLILVFNTLFNRTLVSDDHHSNLKVLDDDGYVLFVRYGIFIVFVGSLFFIEQQRESILYGILSPAVELLSNVWPLLADTHILLQKDDIFFRLPWTFLDFWIEVASPSFSTMLWRTVDLDAFALVMVQLLRDFEPGFRAKSLDNFF